MLLRPRPQQLKPLSLGPKWRRPRLSSAHRQLPAHQPLINIVRVAAGIEAGIEAAVAAMAMAGVIVADTAIAADIAAMAIAVAGAGRASFAAGPGVTGVRYAGASEFTNRLRQDGSPILDRG